MAGEETFILQALDGSQGGKGIIEQLDFGCVLDISARHGVKPLLHAKTKKVAGLPGFFVKDLEESYHENLSRNMFLSSQLRKIVQALNSKNISFMVFKGVLLAEEYYGDVGLRPMADLDILVREKERAKTGEILGSLGYFIPTGYDSDFSGKYRSHIPYVSDHRIRHSVEVHWALTQKVRFSLDMDGIWTGSETYSLDGIQAKSMSRERLLSYLCVHFTHHLHYPEGSFRPKLIWLYDIHLLVGQGSVDWEGLVETAKLERTRIALYAALYLARRFLGTNVPENVLDGLKPGFIIRGLLHFLLDDSSLYFRRYPKSKIACTLLSELLIERMLDRFAFTVKFILREIEYLFRH
ncbi:MAG: nucleotidyltransferase family protein [Candidatus Altiarchaeota archaeon]